MSNAPEQKIDPFAPWTLRGLELRNRFIKAATYEGHCPGGRPDREGLAAFHEAFARGGAGLCTVSYGSVEPGGRTFDDQMCLQDDILDDLSYVTGKIHAHGAKAAIQLAHCGGMSKWSGWVGRRARGPSGGFNSLGAFVGTPLTRAFKVRELRQLAEDYASSAVRAVECGFDALELHMGHGYLLSQFLCPAINKRKDDYGGSRENRARFPLEVLRAVREAVGDAVPVIVKMTLRDGFRGGVEVDDSVAFARQLEANDADALVLSGGFSSRNAMYLFRGPTFVEELIKAQRRKIDKLVYSMARPALRSQPFEELYFLKHARKVRAEVGLPLICVGGVQSLASVHRALEEVYDAVQLGRALIHDPALVNHYRDGAKTESGCTVCNLCVAEMDRDGVKCVLNDDLPARVRVAH
ncbi:MAG: NADH:flavin oxidoreductase [Gammaproteobacteria bacterium]|nr:NADH:flavin oxidoreductase [Gammaproteobacteria bacterium]